MIHIHSLNFYICHLNTHLCCQKKNEKYSYQGARDAYREFDRKLREGEEFQDKGVVEDTTGSAEVSPAQRTMDAGVFLSSFEGLINPKTKKINAIKTVIIGIRSLLFIFVSFLCLANLIN